MTHHWLGTLAGVALLVSSAGCEHVRLADDIDLELDFMTLAGPSDSLHSPYVVGSSFELYVETNDDDETMNGWRIESSDPSVILVSALQTPAEHGHAHARAEARAAGSSTLTVRSRSGSVLHRSLVEVKQPDRIELYAHGLLLIDRPEDEARADELRVLVGGTSTMLARYYLGGEQLHGNGALSAQAPVDVGVNIAHSFIVENRDWLQVTPTAVGERSIDLVVGDQVVTTVPLVGVEHGDIDAIALTGEDESGAHKGDLLTVLGQAFDSEGRVIYGVEFSWSVNGDQEAGEGDLYRYEYRPGSTRLLSAAVDGHETAAYIHAGDGFVSSSNLVGCSAAPGQPPTKGASLYLIGILLACGLLLRRGLS